MKRTRKFTMIFGLLAVSLLAGCHDDKDEVEPVPEPAASAWDAANMDLSVAPGEDFYRYALGGWMKANEGKYLQGMAADNLEQIEEEVLGEMLASNDSKMEAARAEYACLTSEETREAGMDEVRKLLRWLLDATTREEVVKRAVDLGREGYLLLWDTKLYREPDGLGKSLLKSDAYLSWVYLDDERAVEIYRGAMERMLGLVGLTGEEVSRVATNAVEAEREIMRNTASSWEDDGYYQDYVKGLGIDLDLTQWGDAGFAGIRHAFNNLPLDTLRDYLAWMLVRKNALFLDGGMMDEYLDLAGALNAGTTSVEKVAREHVLTYHREDVLDAVIERLTRPGMMETYEGMARQMMVVARERIAGATWIQDASTREEALRKLDRMEIYLVGKRVETRGGASTWSSAVECKAVSRKAKRESVMAREGTYVTKLETNEFWNRLEFNAMYVANFNLFNVWAGMVTPVVFPGWDDEAFVYGYLGCTMGHEMIHAFDNDGRLFDSEGRMRDWWTAGDAARFEERAVRVRDYFSTLTYGDGYRVDGERVIGECIADLGGVSIAHEAMKRVTGSDESRDANGFTAAQRFFFGFAWYFAEANPETNMNLYLTDEHVYPPLRIVSIYANTDAWYEAFPEVKPGDKWYIAPADRVGVW